MAPQEMSLWSHHLKKHPLNEDRRLHYLIAQLWVVLAQYASRYSKKKYKFSVYDVAPWLKGTAEEQERLTRSRQRREESQIKQQYALFYESMGMKDVLKEETDGNDS